MARAGNELQARLEKELERLKGLLGLGHHLKVRWVPKDGELSGEVKGDLILIYEGEEKPALEVLRHEFLDHAISQAIEPYREVANKLISALNESAYRKKERLVEALSRLLG